MLLLPTLAEAGYWSSLFGQSQFIQLIGLCIVVFLLLAICALAMKSMSEKKTAKARIKSFYKDESGSVAIEFVLVFPILMILFLTFWQIVLMMTGNLMVHYASFTATRSAIVTIAEDRVSEPHNTIIVDSTDSDSKFETIFQAAALALAPIAAVSDQPAENMDPEAYANGIASYFSAYGVNPPNWVENLSPGQIRYVANHTQVRLYKLEVNGGDVFWERQSGNVSYEPRDAVGVAVVHEFPLFVPFAHRFFRDGVTGEDIAYSEIRSDYVLNLEGISSELPPEPEVPRRDP